MASEYQIRNCVPRYMAGIQVNDVRVYSSGYDDGEIEILYSSDLTGYSLEAGLRDIASETQRKLSALDVDAHIKFTPSY